MQGNNKGKRPADNEGSPPAKKHRTVESVAMEEITGDVLAAVPLISIKGGSMMVKIMTQNKAQATKGVVHLSNLIPASRGCPVRSHGL